MRGWRGYFGFCETPEELIALTRWVRLRLRAALWRQWKTPRRRRAALIALGSRNGPQETRPVAAVVLGISPEAGPSPPDSQMRISGRSASPPCSNRVSATSRTAVYGPVRTVVWEGRSREAPPYPDHWPSATWRNVRLMVAIGCKADVPHPRPHRPSPLDRPYRLFPALRLSTDGYPRRRKAASIPSSTRSWILTRSSKAIFRSAS